MLRDKNSKVVPQHQDEIERLNRTILDKDRHIEQVMHEQKNEWAEIYQNQKQTVDKLNQEIHMLR